jgi:hypothetical protein
MQTHLFCLLSPAGRRLLLLLLLLLLIAISGFMTLVTLGTLAMLDTPSAFGYTLRALRFTE